MLWFNFIRGLNFVSLCFRVWHCVIMSRKQKGKNETKDKIEPQHIHVVRPYFDK